MLCLKLISSGDEPLFKAGGAFLCVCSLKAQRNISNMASAILDPLKANLGKLSWQLPLSECLEGVPDLVEGILARQ